MNKTKPTPILGHYRLNDGGIKGAISARWVMRARRCEKKINA
jgi:hypothetical protein